MKAYRSLHRTSKNLLDKPVARPSFLAQHSGKSARSLRQKTFQSNTGQVRTATTYSTPSGRLREAIDKAYKQNPVLLPVLLVSTAASLSFLGLLAYDEYTRIAPQYAAYPTPVEQRLRVALHFTHVQPDPDTAAQQFVEAIKAAEACGMNPFSPEAMGIRIKFAEMLEQFGRIPASIEVLNEIVKDYEERLSEMEDSLSLKSLRSEQPTEDDVEKGSARRNALKSIIQMKVKISTLYESDYVQDMNMAKQTLSDAVGLLVKETKDPVTNGFTESNAAGLSLPEIASILSQMGDLYATSGEEANAVQVYMLTLQPLRAACNGTRSCKEVQVLSNIASTMAVALKKPNAKINGKPATKEMRVAARKAILKWADQAIATAEVVRPEDRDEICELGLLSAQMNRAELLLEGGDKIRSKEAFTSLIPTLREKGLSTLVQVAEQGLKQASG